MREFHHSIEQDCYLVSGTPGSEYAHLSGTEHPDSFCMYRAAIRAADTSEDSCYYVGLAVEILEKAIEALHIALWMEIEDASFQQVVGDGSRAGIDRRMRVLRRSYERAEIIARAKLKAKESRYLRPMRHAEL
jgi:hypothetical protein